MNPVSLTVWVLADNVAAVELVLGALVLIVVTLAIHEGRHPFR